MTGPNVHYCYTRLPDYLARKFPRRRIKSHLEFNLSQESTALGVYAPAISHCKHHPLNKRLLTGVYVPIIVLEGWAHGDERHGWPQGGTKLQSSREHSQENQFDVHSVTQEDKGCKESKRKHMRPDLRESGRALHTLSEGWDEVSSSEMNRAFCCCCLLWSSSKGVNRKTTNGISST